MAPGLYIARDGLDPALLVQGHGETRTHLLLVALTADVVDLKGGLLSNRD